MFSPIKRFLVSFIAALALALATVSFTFAAPAADSVTATTTSFTVNIGFPAGNPCAIVGGVVTGEVVDVSGPLHLEFHSTITDNVILGQETVNPQGIAGVGETTGTVYRAVGGDKVTNITLGVHDVFSRKHVFGLISPNGTYLEVHITVYATDAFGTPIVTLDNVSATCP